MKQAWEIVIAFKLVWVRVSLYFLIPVISAFLSQTETWSGETWDNTHWFLKWRLVLICFLAGAVALVAFVDQSLARAREDLRVKRIIQADKEKDQT